MKSLKILSLNVLRESYRNRLRFPHRALHTADWSPRRPAPHRLQIPRYDTADRGAQSRCFRSCPLRLKKKRCSSRLKQIEFLAYA